MLSIGVFIIGCAGQNSYTAIVKTPSLDSESNETSPIEGEKMVFPAPQTEEAVESAEKMEENITEGKR